MLTKVYTDLQVLQRQTPTLNENSFSQEGRSNPFIQREVVNGQERFDTEESRAKLDELERLAMEALDDLQ